MQRQRLPMKHSNLYDKHHCEFETPGDASQPSSLGRGSACPQID